MSGKDKWVRRFSVDETARHKNGFTIYKITSVLFPLTSPDAGTIVNVWKRFSEVQRLHRGMRALHAGLGLPGAFPKLPTRSFFKRFDAEVLQERCAATKRLLELIADHRLLFASTEFVNFLQTGHPEPEGRAPGVINEIRSALHLPLEDSPPLEYQTDDEDRTPGPEETAEDTIDGATIDSTSTRNTIDVSDIEIFEAADVEMRKSPKTETKDTDSFESLNSLESIKSDLFEEVTRMTIDKPMSCVRKRGSPDLIDFAAAVTRPATSSDFGGGRLDSEPTGESPAGSYVFSAGLALRRAAARERAGHFAEAFQLYKRGIETMLLGAQGEYQATPKKTCFGERNDEKKWNNNWKPKSLRSKKYPALCATNMKRPFERVAESKLEISALQKTILEEELLNKRKQWVFEEEEREHKKEIRALKKITSNKL